jgi:hypothetical protein
MIARETGMTFGEIGDMELADLHDLQESWDQSPPVSMLVAAYLGVKPKEEPRKLDRKGAAELMALFGGR